MNGGNQFVYFATAAYDMGDKLGRLAGMGFFLILLIALAMRSFSTARKPGANFKCACSLGVLLSSFSAFCIVGIQTQTSARNPVIAGLASLFGLFGFLSSIYLAIWGLMEYRKRKGTFVRGRAHAVWTLALAVPILSLAILGAIAGKTGVLNRDIPFALANQTAPQLWQSFDDLNFRILTPGKPWVQLDAKKLNKEALVAFAQVRTPVYFMIFAAKDQSGLATSDSLVELVKGNLRGNYDSLRVIHEVPLRRQGLDGVELEMEAQRPACHFFYREWMCVTNGFIYQLVSWGAPEDQDYVQRKSEELFSTFALLDYHRQAVAPKNIASDFHSELFRYSIRMGGSSWRPSPLTSKNIPQAEFAAWDAQKSVGLFVVPVYTMKQEFQRDIILQSLAGIIGISYPDSRNKDETIIHRGELSGVEFTYEKPLTDGTMLYRARMICVGQIDYLMVAYCMKQKEDALQMMESALERVEIMEQGISAPGLEEKFNEHDRLRQGLFLNELGLRFYKARQYDRSSELFRTAFDFEKKSGLFLANLSNSYSAQGKKEEALKCLEENLVLLSTNQPLKADRAFLQMQLERDDEAVKNFAALFSEGYRNDDYFVQYIKLLCLTHQQDAAIASVNSYLKGGDSAQVRLAEAMIYKQQKEYTKAIELLKVQRQKYPYNSEIAYSLADFYFQSAKYPEAVSVCDQLITDQNDSSSTYYLRGASEFGMKRYREAKASFELALKRSPNSAEVRNYLDLVSGMLGEGNNTGIKDPINPVSIPDDLRNSTSSLPVEQYIKDHGAYYDKQIIAFSFIKKKELRETDYLRVKVLDASGVAAFSTIQFGFDPLKESIYVNDLKVMDESGKVLATGNVDDYYVVDSSSRYTTSQRKILNIPVSGLRSGSSIEMMVTRQEISPPETFPFTAHSSMSVFPVLQDYFYVCGDTDSVKYSGSNGGPKFERGLYWLTEHPEVYKWEPMEQSPLDFKPVLFVGDAVSTWEQLGRKYLGELGDYMKMDANGKSLAVEMVKNSKDESEKIKSLASYVQTNWTYKALEFGRRSRIPHQITEILRNHYGDCKDHSLLLQQLLDAAGIPAKLALIRTQGAVQKDLPSLDQFDHMIVFLPFYRKGYFLDCTDKGSDLSLSVPAGLARREAFILDDSNPKFVMLPDYSENSNLVSTHRKVTITNGTDVLVHEAVSFNGYAGSALRSYFKEVQPSSRRSYVELQLNKQSAEMTDFKLENIDNTQAPLLLNLDYVIKKQFHPLGNDLLGKLPDVWEQVYASIDPVDHRLTPFEISVPLAVESTIILTPPPGYQCPSASSFRQNIEMDFASAKSEAHENTQELEIDYHLQRRSGKFKASDYTPCRENLIKVLAPLEQTLTFTKLGADVSK